MWWLFGVLLLANLEHPETSVLISPAGFQTEEQCEAYYDSHSAAVLKNAHALVGEDDLVALLHYCAKDPKGQAPA